MALPVPTICWTSGLPSIHGFMSVTVGPGATALTVMPRAPTCWARERLSTSMPALLIAYGASGIAILVAAVVTLTIRPPSFSRGSARWMMNSGALVLIAISRSNASGVMASIGPPVLTAALLTRMSRRACPVRAVRPASSPANRASTSPGVPSSARTGKARPPSFSISCTASRAAFSLLP